MASDIGIPIIMIDTVPQRRKIRKSLPSFRPIPKPIKKNAAMTD
jgi:hypothetical protein